MLKGYGNLNTRRLHNVSINIYFSSHSIAKHFAAGINIFPISYLANTHFYPRYHTIVEHHRLINSYQISCDLSLIRPMSTYTTYTYEQPQFIGRRTQVVISVFQQAAQQQSLLELLLQRHWHLILCHCGRQVFLLLVLPLDRVP